ncbi:MAG TPA: hypothetical protein VF142_10935 [Longimicrobium sp.]
MRVPSTLARSAFGAAIAVTLGSGVNAATATRAEAKTLVSCPGYTESAQICTDCCWNNWGGYGFWDAQSKYCNCAL